MNYSKKKIFSNAALLSGTEVMGRCMRLILVVAVARMLGPETMGLFAFSLSLVGIFEVINNWGFNQFIEREISRDHKQTGKFISEIFLTKLLIYFTSVIVIYIITLFIFDNIKLQLVWIAMLNMFFTTFFLATNSFFRAHQKPIYEVISRTAWRILSTSAGLILLWFGFGIVILALSGLVIQIIICVPYISYFVWRFKKQLKMPRYQDIITLLERTWRFLLLKIVQRIFNSIDILMLSWIATDWHTGLYAVSIRLSGAFSMIPQGFSGAFFPAISRLANKSQDEFNKMFGFYYRILVLLGVGVCIFFVGFAENIIVLIFGDQYIAAIPTLMILSLGVLLTFATWPLTNAVIATGKENCALRFFSICALTNILLNLVAIPLFQENGAACTTVISKLVLIWLVCSVLGKNTLRSINFVSFTLRPIIAGLGTLLVMFFLQRLGIHICFQVIGTAIIFCGLALATKCVFMHEIKKVINLTSL